MPKRTLPDITIIRDTREQRGWTFDGEEKKPGQVRIMGTEEGCLDCGDYAIKGMEDLVRIERKNSWQELFGNYSPVASKERFEREMEKLRLIKHRYILIEANLCNDLISLTVPQYYNAAGGPAGIRVYEWLLELQLEYDVNVQFVGDCGKRIAKSIFKQIARKYT